MSFGVGDGDLYVGNSGLTLGGEHLFDGAPQFCGVLNPMDMGKNFPGERLLKI
jgi:hypothetical protein